MKITDLLGKRIVFFDGAMGSMLQKNGLKAGELPEIMNITQGDVIKNIHLNYLDAGCDLITTNTLGANRIKLCQSGYCVEEIINAAIKNAKKAISLCGGKERFIAFDIGPTGKLLEPLGDLSFDDAYSSFSQAAVIAEKSGADLAIIETMTDTYEMKAAVLAVKENTSLPVFATFSFDINGRLLTGGDIECAVALLEGLGVDALGINCGNGPDKMIEFLEKLSKLCSLPIIVQPNAGIPKVECGNTVFDVDAEEFANDMLIMAQKGAHILGGCCGTTPEHIKRMIELCSDIEPAEIIEKDITIVSSYANACKIGPSPVIIGERINPTGKKLFKEALRKNNFEYILDQGLAQADDGAHILDVNVGLPDIDENVAMQNAITSLQSLVKLPLQIDTSDTAVMEAALRVYNGKALINSVNGKMCEMKKIFPLVKKYGGVVVGLTLDENGIPETPEGRLEIARKIINTAEEYGINKKNIIIDALTLAVSSSPDAAKVTLQSLALIKKTLGVKTVLGVSNVSFGLPSRDVLNSTFFSLALYNGLDACIINPGSSMMMNVYYAFKALLGLDEQCGEYIRKLSAQGSPYTETKRRQTLFDSILGGMAESACELTIKELQRRPPQDIVESILVPALDEVGKGFDNKTLFLPQLMKCAQAAQSAFAVINENLAKNGCKQKNKGRIVIATVKGDIHDIGKNIVKVMLENYGYEVIDLGRDTDSELIAKTVENEGIRLLGLSALMTTTVPSMEQTIKLIRDRGLDCKIMVGGAVMTPEYAKKIKADFYAKDAMAGVSIAKKVFD